MGQHRVLYEAQVSNGVWGVDAPEQDVLWPVWSPGGNTSVEFLYENKDVLVRTLLWGGPRMQPVLIDVDERVEEVLDPDSPHAASFARTLLWYLPERLERVRAQANAEGVRPMPLLMAALRRQSTGERLWNVTRLVSFEEKPDRLMRSWMGLPT